ncbi:GNAT family N-acetyltransferase [Guyparkeria hydrothermalis]|uniref:tRNA(Met) cytidine acetyltransferase TmcA n=1 Tax=Guyparkeria hydrothermalis TaxID=923 RepID=UPI00202087AF|nr:GNAT family N-acetyltransferase [Guyparkeria hydrothermalis]MCL7744409.1 GNAT family N-acetyltransferase [Guyparkeria hydrothermalis]
MAATTLREDELRDALDAALPAWRRAGHRLPILISGCRDWALSAAQSLVSDDTLWVGPDAPASVRSTSLRRARESLGGECDRIVFNALSGFDPDALGAVAGLPRAGGCLILLAPPLADWSDREDPELARITPYPFTPADAGSAYIHRLIRLLAEQPVLWRVSEGQPLPPAPLPATHVGEPKLAEAPCRTPEQAEAVERILAVANGRPRRPLVLRSHRGRGKSSALGIAAARTLQMGLGDVLVTAPRREAARPLFERAAELLGVGMDANGAIPLGEHQLRFVPPDVLIEQGPSGRLLLVDEAAALPAGLLDDLFESHSRCVFATTEHGYEGSGRGFALRFLPRLEDRAVSVYHQRLTAPIRWAADDPLETLIDRLLLLDAEPADLPADGPLDPGPPRQLDRNALAVDEARLVELFGLLVSAHYRTTPRDLRQLLEAPGTQLWAIEADARILATAVVQDEGGLPASLAEAVFAGERRLHGHLLPQTLAAHAGQIDWPTLSGRRIQRIAVHPSARLRGLGRQLVAAIAKAARADGQDFLGVSFGAQDDLVDFWQACNLVGLHLGQHRDPASGEQAMVMATGLSPAGKKAIDHTARRLVDAFADRAAGPLRHADPARLVRLLASTPPIPLPSLDDLERRQIEACAYRQHHLDAALGPLRRLLPAALTRPAVVEAVTPDDRALLVGRFLQLGEEAALARRFDLAGRRQIEAACRQTLGQILAVLSH